MGGWGAGGSVCLYTACIDRLGFKRSYLVAAVCRR